nr:MAG TPA: hypothetical protein [Caudoviricetes sp.]
MIVSISKGKAYRVNSLVPCLVFAIFTFGIMGILPPYPSKRVIVSRWLFLF